MSLSSFLEITDVKERSLKEFQNPPFNPKKELLVKKTGHNNDLIKSSFKYLMRFKLELLNPNIIADPWVADYSLEIAIINEAYDFYKNAAELVKEARENLSTYKSMNKESSDNNIIYKPLIESAFYLAQIDSYFFNGSKIIKPPTSDDLNELEQLISLVSEKTFLANNLCLWNPNFGEASRMVGGAETDLIMDDSIIQIEMSEGLNLPRDVFNNLIGSYCLYQIGGASRINKQHPIENLGIYFSRYAYLHVIPLKTVLNSKSFPAFLEWFEERACQEFDC